MCVCVFVRRYFCVKEKRKSERIVSGGREERGERRHTRIREVEIMCRELSFKIVFGGEGESIIDNRSV